LYEQEAIYLRSEFWRGTTVVKNGLSVPVGFAFNHLKPEFERYPRSQPLFARAQRNARLAATVNLAGLLSLTGGTMLLLRAREANGSINKDRLDLGLGMILGGSLLAVGATVPLTIRSQRQLADAVFLRNLELLKQ
jgi:hypothetical protein